MRISDGLNTFSGTRLPALHAGGGIPFRAGAGPMKAEKNAMAPSSFPDATFGKRLKIQIGQQTGFVVQPEIAGGNPEMTLEKT